MANKNRTKTIADRLKLMPADETIYPNIMLTCIWLKHYRHDVAYLVERVRQAEKRIDAAHTRSGALIRENEGLRNELDTEHQQYLCPHCKLAPQHCECDRLRKEELGGGG